MNFKAGNDLSFIRLSCYESSSNNFILILVLVQLSQGTPFSIHILETEYIWKRFFQEASLSIGQCLIDLFNLLAQLQTFVWDY